MKIDYKKIVGLEFRCFSFLFDYDTMITEQHLFATSYVSEAVLYSEDDSTSTELLFLQSVGSYPRLTNIPEHCMLKVDATHQEIIELKETYTKWLNKTVKYHDGSAPNFTIDIVNIQTSPIVENINSEYESAFVSSILAKLTAEECEALGISDMKLADVIKRS